MGKPNVYGTFFFSTKYKFGVGIKERWGGHSTACNQYSVRVCACVCVRGEIFSSDVYHHLLASIWSWKLLTDCTLMQMWTHANTHIDKRVRAIVSRIFLIMIPEAAKAVTRDHREADSSKLGLNLEGIQGTVITRGKYTASQYSGGGGEQRPVQAPL